MFESWKSSLQRKIITIRLKQLSKNTPPPEITADTLWHNIDSVLVIMGMHTAGCPDPVFNRLIERFPEATILALRLPGAPITVTDAVFNDPHLKFSPLEHEDVSMLGTIGTHLRERLTGCHATLAIDLSLTFDPLSAYICQQSGARIKIGFARPEQELVFNYQIAPGAGGVPDDWYSAMARYIG